MSRVGGLNLVSTGEGADTPSGVWEGRVERSPGDEGNVFVEASWYAAAELVIEGEFVDASAAGPARPPQTRSHRVGAGSP